MEGRCMLRIWSTRIETDATPSLPTKQNNSAGKKQSKSRSFNFCPHRWLVQTQGNQT